MSRSIYDYDLPEIRPWHESESSLKEKDVFNEKRRSRFNQSLQNKLFEEPLLPEKEFLSNEPKKTRNSQRPNMLTEKEFLSYEPKKTRDSQRPNMLNTQRPNILNALPGKNLGAALLQQEMLDVLVDGVAPLKFQSVGD